MPDSLRYRIAITFIKGIGPSLTKNLIAYTGSAEGIFHEKGKNLEKIPGIGIVLSKEILNQKEEALEKAEKEIEFIRKNDLSVYFFSDKSYPFRLKECPDAPVLLYGKGNINLNDGKFVAIVGTRKATEAGKENCRNLIAEISKEFSDVTIVSGLAYGIDICAHKAALEYNLPTVGVLGHGLDRIYPSLHTATAKQMQLNGGVLTEFACGTNPDKPNFVQRNRIIAGLSDALIIVESKEKGGALITATMANDYNRDVFAFPGRVNDEFSSGCNKLIKNNTAQLIESADDLINCMNWEKNAKGFDVKQTSLFIELSAEEQNVYNILYNSSDGIHINEIALQYGKPFSKVSSLLLEMEFKNLVKCLPGNIYIALK